MLDWLRGGPVQSWINGHSNQQPSVGSRALQGAKIGAAAGPLGAAIGGGIGALAGWIESRGGVDALANPGNERMSAGLDRAIAQQGVDIGDPQTSAERMGPSADLAGSDGSAAPWYDDTTANADDPLGLVPDYGHDGPDLRDENGDGRVTPDERRDAARGGYGGKFAGTPFQGSVTNFMVGGAPVILGSGDPNGRYRNRGRN